MSIIKLNANEYLKGLKWSLMPKYSIDTVKGKYITNEINDELEQVASVSIKKVIINNEYVDLPVSEDIAPTYETAVSNTGTYRGLVGGSPVDYQIHTADAMFGVTMASVSITLKSTKPVVSDVQLEVSLSGITKKRTESSWDNMYFTSISDIVSDLNAFPSQSEDFTSNSELQNYEIGKVIVAPFIKSDVSDNAKVNTGDIWAQWDREHSSSTLPGMQVTQDAGKTEGWNYYNVSSAVRAKGSITENVLWYQKRVINIVQSFTQIDQYTFSVVLSVPVKAVGGAKTRAVKATIYTGGTAGNDVIYSEGDPISLIELMDLLKEITITVKGKTVNDDKVDFGYSLDNQGELTTSLKNMNVFSFIESELVTPRTVWGMDNWMTSMSKYILDEYVRGKYQVEFDIYLHKLFSKNISINSQLKIMQLNSLPIRRDDRDVLFLVKSIEKQADSKGYLAHIKAVEGATTAVDDFRISLVYKRYINLESAVSNKYLVD